MPFPRLAILPVAALLAALPALASSIEVTDIRTFSIPFADYVDDVSINDNGAIVGTSFDVTQNIPQAGFLIPGNGASPVQIKYPGSPYTYVYGINNQGLAVGYALNGGTYVGFTEKNGSFTTFQAGAYTFANGINNNGVITGYAGPIDDSATGFLLKNGAQTNFSVPGYPFETSPTAINDSDQITGYYNFSGFHGFLRNPDGSFQLFGFQGYGINNAGIVVGTGAGPDDSALAFVRIGGTTYSYEFPGAPDTYLYGINNLNEVVGIESNNGFNETIFEGQLVYVSIPEPSTVWLCAVGFAALFIALRRRCRILR